MREDVEVVCSKCRTASDVPEEKVPVGRSYFVCPKCEARINIFKGLQEGSLVINLVGVRFFDEGDEFSEVYCEPGEFWTVMKVTQPCPDRGDDKSCELNNKGRCPNQRLLMRLERNKKLYKTCLYRNGRKVFDKTGRSPVGAKPLTDDYDDDRTYRVF